MVQHAARIGPRTTQAHIEVPFMRFIPFLAAFALSLGCSSLSQNPYVQESKLPAIVRLSALMSDGNEHFFCSGTVISDKYIITAAHCIAGAPYDTEIIIKSSYGVKASVAKIRAQGMQLDYAILEGNFHMFQHMPVERSTMQIQESFEHSSEVQSCGYPGGGELVCKSFSDATPYVFMYSAAGVSMYPGMSGGPVIDMETGRLIGVNSAMTEHEALLTPIIEIFQTLNVLD